MGSSILPQPTANPVLQEIMGLSPSAKAALGMAGHAMPGAGGPPALPAPGSPNVSPAPSLASQMPQDAGPAPAVAPIHMPTAPPPQLGAPSQPDVIAPRGTLPADMNERGRLIATGPGEDQIYGKIANSNFGQNHPFFGKLLGRLAEGAAKIGDIGLSTIAPEIAINTPGTAYHHMALLNQANNAVAGDVNTAKGEAETADQQAGVGEKAAEVANLSSEVNARDNPKESWKAVTGFQGPNGEPLEQEQTTGNYRVADLPSGVKPIVKTPEGETPLGTSVGNLNKALQDRYQVLNPGKELPSQYQLPANATKNDYARIDKALAGVESAQGTEAQRATANAMRQQAFALQQANSASRDDTDPALVQQIGTGRMPVGRMSYLMARNPKLLVAVSEAFPDFDASKIESYAKTYNDFTSGKTSVMLNSGGTALGHLAELQAMNTYKSHIPGYAAYNAYENKADTVAVELAKFYGDATVPAIAAIKKTLTATLPGNRQAAIRTQAQSMGDKISAFEQEWKNAAPSKQYQAPMPGISDAAYHALAKLSPKAAQEAGVSGSGSGSIVVKAPNGKSYPFKDQASADAFKKEAGIK